MAPRKTKKLGRPDSQSSLFPKAESPPHTDFGIPWGAATHTGGWTKEWGQKEWSKEPGLEVSGLGFSAGSPGLDRAPQAPIAPSPSRMYKGQRHSEMQVEDFEETPPRSGPTPSLRHWQTRAGWEPRSGSSAARTRQRQKGHRRATDPAHARGGGSATPSAGRGPTPLDGPRRPRRTSTSSGTLPFETSLAPEFLSLFAS